MFKRPKVLVVVSTPWTYRNLFCTELGARLTERIDPVYICFRKDTYEQLVERAGNAPVYLVDWSVSLAETKQALWDQFVNEAAVCPGKSRVLLLNYRNERDRSRRHKLRRALGLQHLPIRPLRSRNSLRRALQTTAAALLREPAAEEVRRILSVESPNFVWLGTSFVEGDNLVSVVAAEANIPLATTVLGWDNLSSKALPVKTSIAYTVWGDAMAEDLRFFTRLCGIEPKVARVGSPQFDVHSQYLRNPSSRESVAARYGLSPNRKIALYGCSAPLVMPNEPDLVSELIKHSKMNAEAAPQWLVRLHPKDDGSRWTRFESEGDVAIHQPLKQGHFRDWRPDDAQVREMVEQIGLADVVVTNASTILLDACILDRPVVANRYEPDAEGVRRSSILFDYHHLDHALQFKAFPVCRSVEEISSRIEEALTHPEKLREARAKLVADIVSALDGSTTDRILTWLTDVSVMTASNPTALEHVSTAV